MATWPRYWRPCAGCGAEVECPPDLPVGPRVHVWCATCALADVPALAAEVDRIGDEGP